MLRQEIPIEEKKEKNAEFDMNNYFFKGDLDDYEKICFTIIEWLAKNKFHYVINSKQSYKGYSNVCDIFLRNYYNSKIIPEKQKQLIKADRKIKFLILYLLKNQGIWTITKGKFIMNEYRIEKLSSELKNSENSISRFISQQIKSLKDNEEKDD